MNVENLLVNWKYDRYRLAMWDSGRTDWRGQTVARYKLWHNGQLIFEGKDFAGSPLHADDSKQTIAARLDFLSLRPGDTDPDYFEKYKEKQIDWARNYGEELSMIACELLELAMGKR